MGDDLVGKVFVKLIWGMWDWFLFFMLKVGYNVVIFNSSSGMVEIDGLLEVFRLGSRVYFVSFRLEGKSF